MQSSIAVIASLSLFGHELWIASGRTTKSKFKGALVAALVDFHKSQCYFLGTVQTVALTFMFSEIDSSILGLLATGGFIPIVYTLACIGRYGRKSGYCILLSAITFSLASTPLIMSWVRGGAETTPPGEASVYSTFCGVPHTLRELLYPICGSSSLDDNFIGQDTILHSPLVWIVWAYCGLWLFIYIFGVGFQALFQALFPRQYSCIERLLRYPPAYSWTILFGGTWALCFCFQFYLFSVYFKHSLISMEWTLGQIIAITIWTPSIVEYIYILICKGSPSSIINNVLLTTLIDGIEAASRYRYPSPFKVMKGVAYESVNLAMVNVPRQNQGGKSNSEPRNDDTFLLDRSSRRSRSRRTSTRAHRDIDE